MGRLDSGYRDAIARTPIEPTCRTETPAMTKPFKIGVTILACMLTASPVSSQVPSHPFVFSLLPASGPGTSRVTIFADLAYGEQMFAALGPEHLEQRVGTELRFGSRVMVVAQGGMMGSSEAGRSRLSGQVEVFRKLTGERARLQLAVGLGGGRDYSGTGAALGRVVVGGIWARNTVVTNIRLERAFGNRRRDALDLNTTVGFAHAVTSGIRLGVEGVAEDLEGIVESDEAEGGAKLMLGPSLALGSPKSAWGLTLTGGPVFRLSRSTVSGSASGASRTLGNGFVLRTSVVLRP
jgi:hypothetical protein